MKSYYSIGEFIERSDRLARKAKPVEHEPCYFYHVSKVPICYSDDVYMGPRYIDSGECCLQTIKRICVAPTVEQCITAIASKANEFFWVYRTVTKVNKSYIPYGVFDAPITQERWLKTERKFKLVATIPACQYFLYNKEEGVSRVEYMADFRGSSNDFGIQHKELYRLRRFFKKHEANYFFNDIEAKIHQNQRELNKGMNRNEIRKLHSSSSY